MRDSTDELGTRQKDDHVVFTNAGSVVEKPVEWLWPWRIPAHKYSLLSGIIGAGKSQLLCYIAAQVSTGGDWPNGEGAAPRGHVIILSDEDDPDDTLVPRLRVAGADLSRIEFMQMASKDGTERQFDVGNDVPRLLRGVEQFPDLRLLIVDPITSFMGAINNDKAGEVQRGLAPIRRAARDRRFAFVGITHMAKSTSSAVNAAIGSQAFAAKSRSFYVLGKDVEDKLLRHWVPVRVSNAPEKPGLSFRVGVSEDNLPVIEWGDATDLDANEVVNPTVVGRGAARSQAERFLREMLADGPMLSKDIMREARDRRISAHSVGEASKALFVEKWKEGSGPWWWRLPEEKAQTELELRLEKTGAVLP